MHSERRPLAVYYDLGLFEPPARRPTILYLFDRMKNTIVVERWNKILLLITCVVALFVDPLFFYLAVIEGQSKCFRLDGSLVIVTVRTSLDFFYAFHVIVQFQTGYIAPSSGTDELIDDPLFVAKGCLSLKFIVDILSIIPLPQVLALYIIPITIPSVPYMPMEFLKYIVLLQYVPRLVRIYPLFREVARTSGVVIETAWAGAAFNLLLYMLASHVVGALWYLFSVESNIRCWTYELENANLSATTNMGCRFLIPNVTAALLNSSCPLINPDDIDNPEDFNFGIFIDALRSRVVESTTNFPRKIFYCFWWGLRNLSSFGQNLNTSTSIEETLFAIFIAVFGLVLFALLIGNMQKYLQSMQTTAIRAEIADHGKKKRAEKMRIKRQDAEQWMSHHRLPEYLRERFRRYEHYKWQHNGGVENEARIHEMPKDLRKEIQRHLCLDLLPRVPLFSGLDGPWLNALCDKLNPVHYIEKINILIEGDLVDEMIFILRGKLIYSSSTNSNSTILKAGGFFGEELIGWAINPNSLSLPISTGSVKSISEVEAFSLTADDLKAVVLQFRHFHIPRIRHTYRFYSTNWRTWAACLIQATWRRRRRWRIDEKSLEEALVNEQGSAPSLGSTIYAARFATNALLSLRKYGRRNHRLDLPLLPQKPDEPDFTA